MEEKKSTLWETAREVAGKTSGTLLFFFSFVYGIFFSDLIFRGGCGIGVPITTAMFYLFFLPFIIRKGKKFSLSGWLALIPIVTLAVLCGVLADGPWKFYAVLTILVLQILQLVKLSGMSSKPFYSFSNGFRAIASVFGYPFMTFGSAYRSLGGKSRKKGFTSIGKTVLGIAIAIPAAAILILMFSSADDIFEYYTKKVVEFFNIDWGGLIFDIIMGLIISSFIFPLIFSYRIGYSNEKESSSSIKGIDAIVLSAFIFVCDIVYVAFVAVQFTFLFSPDRKLPADMTFAEYGRSGFFQLVAIIAVTFAFIAVVINFVRKNAKGEVPIGVKISLSIMTISDIIIACSATYRMSMYLDAYGLTRARVIACWFIAVICLVLLGVLIKIWAEKIKICSYVGIVITVMVIALNVMNVDALIARVNISRYLDEKNPQPLDFAYLSSENLSTAAVPEIERLIKEGTDEDAEKALVLLGSYYDDVDDFGGGINYQDRKAEKILKKYNVKSVSPWEVDEYFIKYSVCPCDYCYDGKCHDTSGDKYLCKASGTVYCERCGEPMCGFCMEHKEGDGDCPVEYTDYVSCDEYCEDCDFYSYAYGTDHCYCTQCGKQLA